MTDQQTAPQQPTEPQITQPLVTFATTAPEPPQMPLQHVQNPVQEPVLEPQIPASYQSIIDQQNEQIAALMAQNQALNGQITQMVQNGAQFAQQPIHQPQPQYQHMQAQPVQQFPNYYEPANPMQQFNPPSLALDQDVSLESLAEQIGKKEGV